MDSNKPILLDCFIIIFKNVLYKWVGFLQLPSTKALLDV
jgi:hypothetical protein